MSVSKLESLPNEVLCDILEKYINGIDVAINLNHQLNQRFTTLISHCQRLRFDFVQCRKIDFRFCMGLLPAYIDQIGELALSEVNTPGQIHAFLSFYPTFAPFKNLRKLSFHCKNDFGRWEMVERAFHSLFKTAIDTVSIRIEKTNNLTANSIVANLFQLQSLQRLFIVVENIGFDWDDLRNTSSNIEHLTLSGVHCSLEDLRIISQSTPRLKYLNVQIDNDTYYYGDKKTKKNDPSMRTLRTLVISFHRDNLLTFDVLRKLFEIMPGLNRLDIVTKRALLDADAWQMLLKTSLPSLKYFHFQTSKPEVKTTDFENILASFQKPFWLTNTNFNAMIIEQENMNNSKSPITQCWVAPDRSLPKAFITVNKVRRLSLSRSKSNFPENHYFENVKNVTLQEVDASSLNWLTTYVNCAQIRELKLIRPRLTVQSTVSLLTVASNLNTLAIPLSILLDAEHALTGKMYGLKYLDISQSGEPLGDNYFSGIAKICPYLEHLKIRRPFLNLARILPGWMQHLRSLTFENVFNLNPFQDTDRMDILDYELRNQTKFLCQIEENTTIVWIDQDTFTDPYWRRF